jgi:CHAD domain-containing protein
MPAATRRYDLLTKRLEQFTRMLHGLEDGSVRALHRTRVASRRLREVLPVLQIDPDVSRKLNRRLRKVTKRLGAVRELDVLALLIEELRHARRHDARSVGRLAAAVAHERTHARERLASKLPIAELQRIAAKLDKLAASLDTRDPSRGWRWAIDARVNRRATALKQAIQDAGAVYLPDRLHTVRIALKKLRYALELSAESAGLKTTSELGALRRAQVVLGRVHDMQVLIDRVRQLQASLSPPDLAIWSGLDALIAEIENDCRRVHARFVREGPTLLAVCDRVSTKPPAANARRAAS